jgi:hypothetical protein
MNINSSDTGRLRLESQQLNGTTLNTAGELVAWFGAVQGQEYALTKWGLGLRLSNLLDSDIEKELTDGKIFRTHLLRPTWHFVTSEDIHWLLKLTSPRINATNAYMYRKLDLDEAVFNKCNSLLTKLLQGHRQLTRIEINGEFGKNKIEATGHRLSYIMMRSELDGILCSGARQGNQFTYALLEERVPKRKKLNREEALAELAKRYFISRGPATVFDFSTWSGLTLTECRQGIELSKSCFDKMTLEKKEYYFSTHLISNLGPYSRILLLPIYDEFIMGYKDRSAIMEFKQSLNPNPSFHFNCMIVLDGQIIGTWKRTLEKKQIVLKYNLFGTLSSKQNRELENIIQRFAAFHKIKLPGKI